MVGNIRIPMDSPVKDRIRPQPWATGEEEESGYSVIQYDISFTLDWGDTNNADLDAYMKLGSDVCYFSNGTIAGMTLNQDAHPVCDPSPSGPEIISGSFTGGKTFYVWYDQFSDCSVETTPTTFSASVTNTGTTDIIVNGTTVTPGNTSAPIAAAYAGYNTGSSPGYASGTEIAVTR